LLRYGAFGLVAATLPAEYARAQRVSGQAGGTIVSCAIHPAIGVARLGNSPGEYFLGPEVPGVPSSPAGGFKDLAGRVKRQAARFRIYGLDANGNVVRELTSQDAQISWTVHVANKKASWYGFSIPFDIPEAMGEPPMPNAPAAPPLQTPRRNAAITGDDRKRLTIDPGARSIAGASTNAAGGDSRYAFDRGEFLGNAIYLGEIRTDGQGRLLVLGGMGKSGPGAAVQPSSNPLNNDGWQDDISDGTVDATVTLNGRIMNATGAWVVVGPPNFSPGLHNVVTMYDVVFGAAIELDPSRSPSRPSFTRQIYPLLARHVENQWVNAGMAHQFGWRTAGDFLAPDTLAQLADNSETSRFARDTLFRRFRNPAFTSLEYSSLPPYYGDHTEFPAETPRQWLAVLPNQYGWLSQWAAGDFDADWPAGGLVFPGSLEDLPVAEQPDALDRAALDECNGGAFHPGTEMTFPMRILSMYEASFRLRRRSDPEPDWGDMMTSAIALGVPGPLSASGPGDITRWMALPWQADTANCASGYEPDVDEYLPTFWPAGVPNDVLAAQSYAVLTDPAATAADKQSAFEARAKWLRGLPLRGGGTEAFARINALIANWSAYGIVSRVDGPAGDSNFPADLWVEMGRDPSLDR
jgi:hypothetical protein